MSAKLTKRIRGLISGDGLKARAAKSTFWTIGGNVSQQFLRLASNLVLTRILFPEAFGMMAIVQVFLTGLQMFSDMGIRPSIVQNSRSHEPSFLHTAWTLQVIRGFVLWAATCAIAVPVAQFYDEPLLAYILPVVGLNSVVAGFFPSRIHTASRDLLIGHVTRINIAGQVVGIISTVAWALALQSVWSLVIGGLFGPLFRLYAYWRFLPGERDRFALDRSAAGELINFGKWIFVSSAAGFLVNSADRAILGRYISLDLLGVYSVGFFLASVPLLMARPLASAVIFPLYKHRPPWESEENRRKLFRVRRLMTGVLLIGSMILALAGDLIVRVLYDERYVLAGAMLVVMAVSQMPSVIVSTYDRVLLAAGDSKRFMSRVVSTAIAQTTLIFLGLHFYGLIGALLAPGLAGLAVYGILVSAVRRYRGWDWVHDLIYGVVAVLIGVAAFLVNRDAIFTLISQTGPG